MEILQQLEITIKVFIASDGADISNILNFERDFPGTKIIKLEQNYRCTGNILSAANAVIKHNENKYEKNYGHKTTMVHCLQFIDLTMNMMKEDIL